MVGRRRRMGMRRRVRVVMDWTFEAWVVDISGGIDIQRI